MTNHVVRLYAAAGALAVFFLAWAGITARPWASAPQDPRVAALAQREQRLQRDAQLMRRLVDRRRATNGAAGVATPAAAASVRIVTLPPVATTRSS